MIVDRSGADHKYHAAVAGLAAGFLVGGVLLAVARATALWQAAAITGCAALGSVLSLTLQRLLRLSALDPGTHLFNRRILFKRLRRYERRCRASHMPMSMIVVDIDNFRQYNNSFGHLTGDRVLLAVADALRLVVRRRDTVCRWGGEEFAVILPGASLADATDIAERLRRTVEGMHLSQESCGQIGVTISAGVAAAVNAQDMEQLVHRADLALYEAKVSKNRVVVEAPSGL